MARSAWLGRRAVLGGGLALAGCAAQGTGPGGPPPGVPYSSADTSGPPQPIERAVTIAAERVLSTTPPAPARQTVVIDPLVDGVTGDQSVATQRIQDRILAVARASYPQFEFLPFSSAAMGRSPMVMVGTFTPISTRGPATDRDAFRFCLVMGDTRNGRAVAKAVTKALPEAVDATPVAFFRDSPAWTDDAMIKSYIQTCQGVKVGDAIPAVYMEGLLTAAIVRDAIEAYGAGHYEDALDLYRAARRTGAGDQLRVHNGLYLTNWRLGRRDAAERSFGELVDYSLRNKRLAVKLLFRPGSVAMLPQETGTNEMWLREIARGAARQNSCLQVSGHTSRSGPAAMNERLSQLRADFVAERLEREEPSLHGRLAAAGFGAKENLVGTGTDDARDALDRRVEFRVLTACT